MNQIPIRPELRQHVRKLLRTTAQLVDPLTGLIEVHTTDISLGGIGVVLNSDPNKGTTFLLRVELPHPDRRRVLLQAHVQVARSIFVASENGFKVGMRFFDPAPSAIIALSEYLS